MSDPTTPDRGHLATEQRLAAAAAIDALSIEATLRLMNTQDMEVPLAIRKAIPQITKVVEVVVAGMKRGGRLIYCGAGTSGRLGVLDASECPPTFCSDPDQVIGFIAGGDTALRNAVEGAEDQRDGAVPTLEKLKLTDADTLIGIAAGGTTPYVWGAIDYAHNKGAKTSLMTCVPIKTLMTRPRAKVVKPNEPVSVPPRPELPAPVYQPIELLVGPEVLTGSTRMKAGTAQKAVLNILSTAIMLRLGLIYRGRMVNMRISNAKLRKRGEAMICDLAQVDQAVAAQALDLAGQDIKLAVLVARGLDRHAAEGLLAAHGDNLADAIGATRGGA